MIACTTLDESAHQYINRLLELPAMVEWYAAALRETWRESSHEAALAQAGDVWATIAAWPVPERPRGYTIAMHGVLKIRRACLRGLAAIAAFGVAQAQVFAPTPKDLETAPQFRAELTGQHSGSLERRMAPAGSKPDTAPHDFTGSYSFVGPDRGMPPAGEMPVTGGSANRGCLPSFVTGVNGNPTHVVSGRDVIVIVQEENHLVRRVYLNAEHPKNLQPSIEGHSIGRFEGDTLVIETVGLKSGKTVVERLRKVHDGRQIESVANGHASLANWRPDLAWVEDICEDAGELFGPQYPTRDWLK